MLKIKKQIWTLYTSSVLGRLSLTGAWVAILADLFGRKAMLIVSSVMRTIGNIVMIFSCNLWMVCAALSFYAMSYNFASGSDDALAYDSLKKVGKEAYYEKYASNQLIIYRLCSGK